MTLFRINVLHPSGIAMPDQTWTGWPYPRGEKPSLGQPLPNPGIRIDHTGGSAKDIPNYLTFAPGAAASQSPVFSPAAFQLAVFVDVEESREAEFSRWYDEEHLPRLTGVEGVTGARRFCRAEGFEGESLRAEPRAAKYLALYSISDPAIVDSPAWINAAATAWTLKLRPFFSRSERYLVQPA